ncbi:hypothetical protein WI71_15370 [Burkholderia diffusa]|nr:hypothetical protein WI71_15370 [Burkholderia diffusa]
MLDLLALELLIKCLLNAHDLKYTLTQGHNYEELFNLFPNELRTEILEKAIEITGPSQLTEDSALLLRKLGRQFIDLRYPHECYRDLSTEAEYVEIGEAWDEEGADPTMARVWYHPEELRALLIALEQITAQYDA